MTAHTTQYGFTFGPAEVTRLHSDAKGNVWIEIKGARGTVQVRVTPTGLVRVEKGQRS
jgi:hypothetical protein